MCIRDRDYEAYEDMAETELRRVARAAVEAHEGVKHVLLGHLVGRCVVGQTSVVVGVAATRRAAAFAAAAFVVDELKTTVPIWKKDVVEWGASSS